MRRANIDARERLALISRGDMLVEKGAWEGPGEADNIRWR
jgi:hypothetical protein